VRSKSNILFQRRYSHLVDKTTGVRSDHTVILTAIDSAKAYPDQLRRVSYLDVKTRKRFKFLTNNFTLPALTIALIYKSRWQVELFFKRIKQLPTDQGILRHQRERGEDANLDRGLGLRAVGRRPQETGTGGQPLPNSTDFERDAF